MKILFVSGNLCDGGAQRVISVVSSELAKRGHEVYLILYSRNENEYPINPKVVISALANSFSEYSKINKIKRINLLRKTIRKINPDVAVGFLEGGYGLYLSTLGYSFPKIASARIKPEIIMHAKGIRATIDRIWFSHADAVVLQNNEQYNTAPITIWNNCCVIPNPVSNDALSLSPDYHETVNRIIMVGRLAEQKNYEMIIKAIHILRSKYPNIFVDIYGKGKQQNELLATIKEYDLEETIFLRGWSQDVLKEYIDSDIYILCSNYEGMPNSLLEAMAVGLPCISTACETGPREMIDDGLNGFLVPVNDPEYLANKIHTLIEMNMQQRLKLGLMAKNKVRENYSETIVVDKWEELFNSLMGG